MAVSKKNVKELPHNLDAEKAVIGATFINEDACLDVLASLKEDDFYDVKNQIIIRCVRNLSENNKTVDMVTVTEELMNIKEFENVGGVPYLQECANSLVAISSLEFYIEIVQNQSVLRKFLSTLRDIDQRYHEEEIEDVDDFVSYSKDQIDKVLERRRVATFKGTKEIVNIVKEKLDKINDADNDSDLIGLDTGYDRLNYYTQGFKKDEMIIVAARPSVGKTALCLNFAHRVATKTKKAVGIFSLEMSSESLCKRLLALSSYVSLKNINSGHLTSAERMKLKAGIEEIENAKIYIDDTPGLRLGDIISKSKKLQANEPNLGMIIIDYLGLVQTSGSSRNPDSRQEEVRKISLALKQLARDLKIPVIVVSQLSRDAEKRDSKRPMMSDLRDSGNIEQDADIVMLLYREDYYDKKVTNPAGEKKGQYLTDKDKASLSRSAQEKALVEQIPGNASYVEVNIAKNRNGQTGKVGLFFLKDYGRFDQPSADWEAEMEKLQNGNLD